VATQPGSMALLIAGAAVVSKVAAIVAWLAASPVDNVAVEAALGAWIALCTGLAAGAGVFYARGRMSEQERARHQTEIERCASYDDVSGLRSFRAFREWLNNRIDANARQAEPVTVAIIDLDNFKEINDRFGHDAGDELLAAVGEVIREQVNGDGVAARYGGDEFAVALGGHDREAAARVIETMCDSIRRASTEVSFNTRTAINARFGLAVYPDDASEAGELVLRADRALIETQARDAASGGRQQERHAQDVFFAIGDAMGRSLDPQETVANLVNSVGTTLGLDTAAIWIVHKGTLRAKAWYVGPTDVQQKFLPVQDVQPITREEAVASGMLRDEAFYLEDAAAAEVIPERFRALVKEGTWSIYVPLTGSREGVLTMSAHHDRVTPPSLSLARAIARLASAAIHNADAYARARRHHEQLAKLSGIGGLLFEEGDFEEQLGRVVERVGIITGSDMLTLDTGDPTEAKPFLRQFYIRNDAPEARDEELKRLWMTIRPAINQGDEISNFLASIRDPIVLDDPANQVPSIYRDVVKQSGARTVVIVPANWQGEMLGLLYFASFRPRAFDEQDVVLMQAISAELAPALQVASLRVDIEHSYEELKGAHTQALLRLAYAAEARDPYTECHLTRIKAIAQAIGERMGLDADDLEAVGYGAIVHDLGKLRIPDSILCNPGTLSDDEWTQMKKHPEWGAEIIGGNAFYDVAREVAHCHHERWDGSGYPRGLAGEEIPLAARIVSVADVYDALTSARPYKNAWPVERALVELMRMRGKTLCPHSVDTFMQLWNDGSIARIDEETLDESLEVDFRAMFAA
jgi:diguanylate cyclase (GGDEF)-like protein